MKRVASLACAVFLLAAPQAGAQERGPAEAVRPALSAQATPAPIPAPAPTVRQGRGRSMARSFLHTMGGALVGAGIGYFTSQVVKSDWDKDSNSEMLNHRATFALGGALFGGAGGMFISSRPATELEAKLREARKGGQDFIPREQIEATGFANVYDLIQSVRPQWLRGRGIKSMTEGDMVVGGLSGTVVVEGAPTLLAYLDNSRLGGVESLQQVATVNVESVQLLSAAEATYRWGIGNAHGAILVISRK